MMERTCWSILFCSLLLNLTPYHARRPHIRRIIEYLNKNDLTPNGILRRPVQPEELTRAEPIFPGHTLLKPSFGVLKSSVKFLQKEADAPVYGNLENLGLTYGNTSERVLYTGFRKADKNLLDMLLRELKKNNSKHHRYRKNNWVSKDVNDASEILDDSDSIEDIFNREDFRRRSKKYIYSTELSSESDKSDSSQESRSSDYERNPGNPYTIYKDKYLQNWMWNHAMDGDHMNINPYAPQFNSLGPSGAALFFNRKWWYFNQDDYRPFH